MQALLVTLREDGLNLRDLQRNWTRMGESDPLWAVATAPQYKGGRWDTDEFFATGEDGLREMLEGAANEGIEIPLNSALDFGCGVGRITQALALRFNQVTAVDIAPTMLAEAKRHNRAGDRVRFVLNESDDLSVLPSNSFDLILSEITLMHMEPRYMRRYMAEFVRLVTSCGVVVFQLPEPSAKQRIRAAIPPRIVRIGNRLRTFRHPMMEVYDMSPRVVIDTMHPMQLRWVQDIGTDLHANHRYWFMSP